MRQALVFSIVLSLLLCIGGCKKTLDTSSSQAFRKSVDDTSKDLPPEKAEKFQAAVSSIMLKKVVLAPGVNVDEQTITRKINEIFGGKGVDDIIEMGEQIKAENKAEIDKMMKGG